jgi:hypothetical protein
MEVDSSAQACRVEVLSAQMEEREQVKYMMDRIEDRVSYLERRITQMEDEMDAPDGDGPARPVGAVAQATSRFVGRICCDAGGVHRRLHAIRVACAQAVEKTGDDI